MATFSPLDLTAEQTERIERAVDLPMTRWKDAHMGTLYPLILAELTGEPVEKYRAMKWTQIVDLVTLSEPTEAP